MLAFGHIDPSSLSLHTLQKRDPSSMLETGHSKLVLWDNPEGWDGEGGGRGVQDGEHMYTSGRFMSMYGKNHYNIVK